MISLRISHDPGMEIELRRQALACTEKDVSEVQVVIIVLTRELAFKVCMNFPLSVQFRSSERLQLYGLINILLSFLVVS